MEVNRTRAATVGLLAPAALALECPQTPATATWARCS
jgi:hypothetical protein